MSWKWMYLQLLDSQIKAIEILQQAHRMAEDIAMDDNPDITVVLPDQAPKEDE